MTFEESLDRLKERHEALTQSVEMLLRDTQTALKESQSHTENIRLLFENSRVHSESIQGLYATSQVEAEQIRNLVRLAESHERRITRLEGGQ